MLEILKGEFFWGIIVGLLLSFLAGWVLAHFTVSLSQKNARKTIIKFCIDTVKNIRSIVSEMDKTRDRAHAIHHDFLALLDVEINIYGRNREQLIHLPDEERNELRNFLNDIAIKRADVSRSLDQFYQLNRLADQIQAEGRGPEAQRARENANTPLQQAQIAADRLVVISNNSSSILERLGKLR